MEGRKYYLDWLRVLAFGLLIPFHVGMLYASWFYPMKSPRLAPGIEWLLMLSTPWRLALIFVIAGVASVHLIAKLGAGRFALDRLRRLLPVILFGMFVVNAPQTWIVAKAHGLTHLGLLAFWPHYLTRPRWDHLWFLLYLLPYGLLFAGLWKLKGGKRWGAPPLAVLLLVPPLWLIFTSMLMDTVWPRTDGFFNDWGAHLQWAGLFVTGLALALRSDAWLWMVRRRAVCLGLALIFCAALLIDHTFWLKGTLTPPASWISYDIISGLYAWAVILTICGYAARWLNHPSRTLSYLNTAILPVYVIHQPILFLAAFVIFPLRYPLACEAALLTAITLAASLAIYHFLIRPFALARFLFGLKLARASG
jgi:hypothetical protein